MFQVDIHKIKLFYMEDDGGSAVVSAVHPEIRVALRKAVFHFDKAYGIKAEKVISAMEGCILPIQSDKPQVYSRFLFFWFLVT
jgi:hypothetical protein